MIVRVSPVGGVRVGTSALPSHAPTWSIDLADRSDLRSHERGVPWTLHKFRVTVSWAAWVAAGWASSMRPKISGWDAK
jgi:hypothetical protein